ncbi:MAG: 23S rRNA (pseudouridine(1915)-N(3))-methyltransferase RlmH [Burkholderiales bacterium]|nr:23S rRNA (pseudouridine(1915)-N(3))-methyltransferase RlmH [Burkholderiales bacterium]
MKLRIVALASRTPAWVEAGYAEYAKRLPRDFAIDLVELKPEPRGRGKTALQVLAAEALRVRAACAGCRMVALDERGREWTTRDLRDRLVRWRDEARDVAFAIGSADGLDEALKRDAHDVVALSKMTLPHALVRVLLAEQLYRAVSLASGHPYHRD